MFLLARNRLRPTSLTPGRAAEDTMETGSLEEVGSRVTSPD